MDRYAVFGNPVEHSLSPIIHETFAKQTEQRISFEKINPATIGFLKALKNFCLSQGKGANITLPFKKEAFLSADSVSKTAAKVKAASCILIYENNKIYADNYDGFGLIRDLHHNLGCILHNKIILIIGAGGAASGILPFILEKKPQQVVIANRTLAKAEELIKSFSAYNVNIKASHLHDIPALSYSLIIHATSLGHLKKTPSLPRGLITQQTYCYDLTYGEAAWPFLQWAKAQGAERYSDGLGMLIELNAATFHLWRGIYPDTRSVFKALRDRFPLSKIL